MHSTDVINSLTAKKGDGSPPLDQKTKISVVYAAANPFGLAAFFCKHKCYRIVNSRLSRKSRPLRMRECCPVSSAKIEIADNAEPFAGNGDRKPPMHEAKLLVFWSKGGDPSPFFAVEELITSVECKIDRGVILSYNQVIKQ